MHRDWIRSNLAGALRGDLGGAEIEILAVDARVSATPLEDQPWLPIKYGPVGPEDWHGVVPFELTYRARADGVVRTRSLVAKVFPTLGVGDTLTPWVLERNDIRFDRPYREFFAAGEFLGTSPREGEVYRLAASEASLRTILPRFYGELVDEKGERLLLLEQVRDLEGLDPTGGNTVWSPDQIEAAVRAAASYQAAFVGREGELTWAGPRPTTRTMLDDEVLWRTSVDNARHYHPSIVSETAARRRIRIVDTIDRWAPAKDAMPTTLAHDDYNPRNLGFRPGRDPLAQRLLALDWEAAMRDTPHRDLVELLTFALEATVERDVVDEYVELHRRSLAERGVEIDRDAWCEGFRAELKVQVLNRVGLQGIWAREFELAFYPAMNATIERLLDLYE